MRWLKSLVIVLGILIVLGVLLLGFGIYKKGTEPEWRLFGEINPPIPAEQSVEPPAVPAAPTPPAVPSALQKQQREPLTPYGRLSLNLRPGCVITGITQQRRVTLLQIGPTSACNAVIALDVQKGVVLGTITPRP